MTGNERTAREMYAAMDAHDIDRFLASVAEDMVEHEPLGSPRGATGRDGVRQWFEMLFAAFPDMRVEVEDVICQDDRVACRAHMHGSHQGEFMGIPASRKPVEIDIFDIMRFEDGRVVEHWGASEDMKMMRQIGALQG